MKAYLLTISLLVMSIISCTKNTGITVTKPGSDLVLSKMQSGTWQNAKADGNTLTITGNNGYDGNYTFESPVLGIGGVYKDDSAENSYILAVPMGPDLAAIKVDQKGKDAVDAILNVLDDEGGEAVIGNLINNIMQNGAENIDLSDADKILANTNLPREKYEEVKSILTASSGGFMGGDIIN
ncbi:hypothetical protein [Brachyspira sp. G79]|uniref:hypothetical protein n=1 Tax=Brachyspira sp. G79 TaxID=1358104 RepID=UPI000BBC0A99|nr:hypothetical protein [Brachyspira sp. G79]PCG20231.1 hypothetical protein KQ44_09555 [Brachyspira sp. G79]